MSNTKNGTIKELPASSNGYRFVVEVEGEEWPWYLANLGIGFVVGDKGVLSYVSTNSRGYWTFKKV